MLPTNFKPAYHLTIEIQVPRIDTLLISSTFPRKAIAEILTSHSTEPPQTIQNRLAPDERYLLATQMLYILKYRILSVR